jgi:hypothetical protein
MDCGFAFKSHLNQEKEIFKEKEIITTISVLEEEVTHHEKKIQGNHEWDTLILKNH